MKTYKKSNEILYKNENSMKATSNTPCCTPSLRQSFKYFPVQKAGYYFKRYCRALFGGASFL